MYRFLILLFAITLMACDNDTPQEKPREQEKHEVPVPKPKPQFDEVGERIWYGQTPAMRLDSTDYGPASSGCWRCARQVFPSNVSTVFSNKPFGKSKTFVPWKQT